MKAKLIGALGIAFMLATGMYAQDSKICDLTNETTLVDADEFVTAQCGAASNERIAASEVATYVLTTATDLEADGTLSADTVAAAEMADADHGDGAWSGGVLTVEAVQAGAAFPGSPASGDVFIVTDDSAVGACDSAAGSALSLCYYNGATWEKLGDGGGGSDTNAIKEINFPAAALSPGMEPADSFPAPVHDEGTNIDVDTLAFDDTTDECAGSVFQVPADVQSGSTITFKVKWYSGTATSGNIIWDFRHLPRTEGESWDAALTTETAAADATQGTVDQITVTTWTETLANTGWAASDLVEFLVCRDANNGSDSLVGDAALLSFSLSIPRE